MKASQEFIIGEALQTLVGRLAHYADDPEGIVLALPGRGLALATTIGERLRIPVEVFIARSLRAPCDCPCTIGVLTESDVVHLDASVIARQQWLHRELRAHIEREMQVQRAEIIRQRQFLRSGCGLPNLTGRHALFVDDGAASSATLLATIEALRRLGVGRIVAALPVKPPPVLQNIRQRVDEMIVRAA